MLLVSDDPEHKIHWAEYGNPKGEPVLFIHGGPGGGAKPEEARFFDPERFRIILFDQRGCGKSQPSVAENPKDGLADNSTPHLIDDINKIRTDRGIGDGKKMHIFGESWGSTLAMAYAIKHPDNVQSLTMRGIFLNRREDLDYFYQGNAATYAENPNDQTLSGAYLRFPEAWKDFVAPIPEADRGDMVAAYAKIFNDNPTTQEGQDKQLEALKAWTLWEGATSNLSHDPSEETKFGDEKFAKAFARIENNYFMNGCFFDGKSDRNNNYLLDNAHKIKDIPMSIIQGQYDEVCPRMQADALVNKLEEIGAKNVKYQITASGHSRQDRDNLVAATQAMDNQKPIKGFEAPAENKTNVNEQQGFGQAHSRITTGIVQGQVATESKDRPK
jgi:proline iminopeptidase